MEIRTILEAGGKVVLVIKCQRTWLNCSSVLWKAEVKSEKLGYLAKNISKQSVEDIHCFFLTSYSKM